MKDCLRSGARAPWTDDVEEAAMALLAPDVPAKKHGTAEAPPAIMLCGLDEDEVPKWLRFPHLTTGYRYGGDYAQALASLFSVHNETLNAWTMIATSLFSLMALAWAVVNERPSQKAIVALSAWCFSALLHLPFSVGYHLFMCISPRVYNTWRRLDVSFIFISSTILSFALSSLVLPGWATCVVVGLSLIITLAALLQLCDLKEGQALDRKAQAAFVGSGVLVLWYPMLYQTAQDTMNGQITIAVISTWSVFASLVMGGWVYADCFPERLSHGTFDIIGSSHQIMHIGVAIAHFSEFAFILDAYRRFQ